MAPPVLPDVRSLLRIETSTFIFEFYSSNYNYSIRHGLGEPAMNAPA